MTDINLIAIVACVSIAGIALVGVLWLLAHQSAALGVNDTAQDARLAALEDRVALLEIPEVVHRATQQHILKQALLDKGAVRNGYGGHGTEERS